MNHILKIEGMSCNHCVKNVENALKNLNGVNHVEVEIGKAFVEGICAKESIVDAIEELGFDVISVE